MKAKQGRKRDSWIPKSGSWTFKDSKVSANFDKHVREQLPWYDLVSDTVGHIGQHYIPQNGLVYDIGASTGNIGRVLAPTLLSRAATIEAIESSEDMVRLYNGPGKIVIADAVTFDYQPFDFAVCFLVLMFLPVATRQALIAKLMQLVKPGGAIVIVDKTLAYPGYIGTCIGRMTTKSKLMAGVTVEEILTKELSLMGCQRPVHPELFSTFTNWFRFGEFAGWVYEKPEV